MLKEQQDVVQLQVLIDPKHKHVLSDALLVMKPEMRFHIYRVESYHPQQTFETVDEKVAGYIPKMRLEVETTFEDYPTILSALKALLPNTPLSYRVIPCLAQGLA
ncbi:hypothetical protein CYQ88_04615 [Hydrogenovibrio sp. SC-1]|uniref:DUF3240 family protein n=1 Tax=Hydrogenovibrio sp. SC-1 TaxID=2065820 RepID=UPI000C7AF0EE|nr:DUF3240 family protein [Hydrogenovibrio sp. SC-1]PLA74599.1 hypothetical protein CYQ88_04615 [Hydrogenovibrio sp. SC-1]